MLLQQRLVLHQVGGLCAALNQLMHESWLEEVVTSGALSDRNIFGPSGGEQLPDSALCL